jgi:hypothetical protein
MLKKFLILLCLGAFFVVAIGAGCKKKEEPEPEEPEVPEEPGD